MPAKLVKIFFLVYLLSVSVAIAQKRENSDTSALVNYNKWLKSIQLDQLVEASKINFLKHPASLDDPGDHAGEQLILVLILRPSGNYTNIQDLATTWNYVSTGLKEKGINIYSLLLNKLADYTGRSLKLVEVQAQTSKPDIFSFKTYFDDKLETESNITLVMGGDISLDYDFNNSVNDAMTGTLQVPGGTIDLTKYYDRITALFSQYKHEPDSAVKCKKDIFNKGTLKIYVYNVYGQVTGRDFHERLSILISVSDPVRNQVKVRYELSAYCASGIKVIPKDGKSYHDVVNEYPEQLPVFNSVFYKAFKKIFDDKE